MDREQVEQLAQRLVGELLARIRDHAAEDGAMADLTLVAICHLLEQESAGIELSVPAWVELRSGELVPIEEATEEQILNDAARRADPAERAALRRYAARKAAMRMVLEEGRG
jgi:hypothetical protein